MRLVHQPAVMGEMISGILLGPTLLGWLAPAASSLLFSPQPLAFLNKLSAIGIVLFMFLTGLQSGMDHIRSEILGAAAISAGCIALPFAGGMLLGLQLPPILAGPAVTPAGFGLFLGLALSITAFPVLARILQDQNATHTRVGTVALTAAALGDVAAWILLPLVLSYTIAGQRTQSVWIIAAGIAVYVFCMLTAGTWLAARLFRNGTANPQAGITAALVIALLSAAATEILGVHAAFGAFIGGLTIPRSEGLKEALKAAIEPISTALLVPLFFAATGQLTDFRSMHAEFAWTFAFVLSMATVGKALPAVVLGRMFGLTGREAVGLGALMNTRGLVEVIIVRIGLDGGLLSGEMFTIMIGMTLCTTLAGPPILAWSQRRLEASGGQRGAVV
jgi:Kef-type K+ transport system membrane component KefB